MAKEIDPYELIDSVETKKDALKALQRAAKASNAGDALEILVMAFNMRFHITQQELTEVLK